MRKPKNREERVDFLLRKCGYEYVAALAGLADSKLRKHFEALYPLIKNKPDYEKPVVTCLRCGEEVLWHSDCACSIGYDRAIFDEEAWIDDIKSNTTNDDLTDFAIQKNKEFKKLKGIS